MTDLRQPTGQLPELLPSKTATEWNFWKVALADSWYLYAEQEDQALHLGAFADPGSLVVQQLRFLEDPKTTVVMTLDAEHLHAWLKAPEESSPPRFIGQLGSHWSGYGVKPLVENNTEVEVIYAADLRHEWMGVFSEPEAFAVIEQHYDRRRKRCLIC
ncbi:hypothetical protein [Marinospirillum insulare]|uniref:Uncharacterized protein n=1 Tax=Marinospirillum insulare TaxID=217169 RepID=A0ABQ6A2Z4_9GAMM|nr:hypothetical protein [Marinospirillum insulare]GLR64593.1 hypothetical protein GCM10007878_20310 [Marinospirillum insulare]